MLGALFGALSGAGAYANAVTFDTSTYLTRGAGFTGLADGKVFTYSGWIYVSGSDVVYLLNAETGGFFEIRCLLLNVSVATVNTSAAQNIVAVTTGNPLVANAWNHIAISIDLTSTSRRFIYVNDTVASVTWTTYNNSNIDMTRSNWVINANNVSGTSPRACSMADIWFNPTYIDLSVEANRRKFIDATGRPVDLAPNGSAPTGSSPILFLSGNTAIWHTNKGTGGGMTENGALTTATTSPSDL